MHFLKFQFSRLILILIPGLLAALSPCAASREIFDWPSFVATRNFHTGNGIVSADEFKNFFTSQSKSSPTFRLNSTHYRVVNYRWMEAFIDWYEFVLKAVGLSYKPEIWDCENYSIGLQAYASLAAVKADAFSEDILVGWLIVRNIHKWAGVSSRGNHAIAFFKSDKGIFVVEPQNGTITHLEKYPNAKYILEVFLP